jgi:2-oxoisovalerate dehydrogenase E1 component
LKNGKRANALQTTTDPKGEDLLAAYRNMALSRYVDDEEIRLKRLNQYYFQISGAGHEAILTAAGTVLRPAYDWFLLYYRDRALCLRLGMTPHEMFLQGVGAESDPNSGGRQMPAHWGHEQLHIISKSSCTGMHALHAVGIAEAGRYLERIEEARARASAFHRDEVVLLSIGDGGLSEGEFWEALNSACNMKLPVLVLVEDNGYAISVPRSVQAAGVPIHEQVASFPNLRTWDVDGTDFPASLRVMSEAVAHCRDRRGVALVRATCIRPYAHSMSDDDKLYRPKAEMEADLHRDPLTRMRGWLIAEDAATAEKLDALGAQWRAEVREASERALIAPRHDPDKAELYLYSPDVDPSSAQFEAQPAADGAPVTMVEAVNRVLHEEMRRDARVLVFGEDVADATNVDVLQECKGKGGVFKATHGLTKEFGAQRCFNSPLAEANIVGRAVGMALRGLKPVVEIQFYDYIWPAYMQIKNELALMRWRSFNHWKAPVVIRVAAGGYLGGGAIYHSQSGVHLFASLPGLRVVMPSNAADAAGLLRTAIRCDDPVLFLEHKHLYRQPYAKAPYPGPEYTVPFGKARVTMAGDDITVVTFGALVRRSEMAAKQVEREFGLSIEVIDLRSLAPWDHDTVAASVRKTGRCLVVYEDNRTLGFGAEVAAWVADEVFEWLDAPVRRVAAMDVPVAYAPATEDRILPQQENVYAALMELAGY